ncbi:lonely Cys domain-containing protein, partial [Streptomyces sp. NPDC001781]
ALVVDPAGRAVERALPEFAQSSSTAHAVLDAATGHGYGALGLEVEKRQRFVISGIGDLPAKELLAEAPGFKIVTDHAGLWRTADGRLHFTYPETAPGEPQPLQGSYLIGEIVVEPMAVLPGERRQSQEEALARLDRVERALDARNAPHAAPQVPLAALLPTEDGWTTTEFGDKALVGPNPSGTDLAYVQPTLGFPALGLSALQDAAGERLPKGSIGAVDASGREFGMKATAQFLRVLTGRTDVPDVIVPFLAPIPDIDDIWGYLRFIYAHTVARPSGVILNQSPTGFMTKNGLAVASRPALDRVLRALRPRTRQFLDQHHDGISASLAATLARLLELYRKSLTPDKPFFPGFFDATIGDVPSAREYTTSALTGRTSGGKVVTQKQMVDMDDDRFPTLDTDDGRLEIPLVLAELRHFAYDNAQLMSPEDIRRAVAELSSLSREAYRRALTHRVPLPEDALRESVNRVLDNQAVRRLAHFVQMVLMAGLPQPGGEARRLMSVGESQRISRALGEYALGTPLPADDPVHQALRKAVDEASRAVDTVPQQHQERLRALVGAAQEALGILADPTRTPPVLSWVPELVALDGSRVLLDRVLVTGHRDLRDRPVGVSSRPAADWQDARRQTYGLLPDVVGYTFVRPGPATLESPVQTLPFGTAHLVGLRGGPGAAVLALSDGSDAVVDYARVVDLLFAVDGHLTALAPESPVLVAGADLAGPPMGDPLEVPLAGEVLADGLDRWVWTTGSGIEPVLVPADGSAGPRWQLAEGDWWVGFRPGLSTAELGRWAEQITGDRGRTADVRRWVRAIRLVYGPLLENDTAALEALLRGFWALEQTRAANGFQTSLTWGDLRFAVSSYFAANGQSEPPLPVALQFLLLSAAGSTGVDLELSRFSIVPQHASVRAWEVAGAGEAVDGAVTQDEEMTLFVPPPGSSAPSASPPYASTPVQSVPESSAVPGALTGPEDFLLSAGTLVTGPSGRPQGRNWTGRPVGRVEPGTVQVVEARPGVAPRVVSAGPAPWPETAYVVAAGGRDGRVRLPDGRVLDAEGLAAVLAADPELAKLPKDVPVVLAVPFAGQQYQETLRKVAVRLGRTVWGASGDGRLVPDGTGALVPASVDRDGRVPVGSWVAVSPSPATDPLQDRRWTALDGTVFHDSDVDTLPLVDESQEWFGRMAMPRQQALRRVEQRFRTFRRMRRLVHWTPVGASYQDGGEEPVSMDAAVYVYAAHGLPGRMGLPLRDGRTVWLGKRDAAAYIAGLPEVRELPPGYRIHLEICWSASDGDPHTEQAPYAPAPHVDDPLGEVSLDQHVANLSQRGTDGATRPTGLDDARRSTIDAANGERGRRVQHPPEPLEHQLDQLAREVGLHDGTGAVPVEVRDAALRVVRALRRVFGNEIEDDRGVPGGRYERVLKGIAALERMRANDPALSPFTPFRMDLLDFYVQEHTGRSPDRAGYLALLDFAAARVAADPTARLTDAVPAPALLATLRQLAARGEQITRHVQSLSASAVVTPRQAASTLWATARAAQVFTLMTRADRETMGRKVLHLDASAGWERSQLEDLWMLLSKATAQGVDVSDHDLLAAYHLKEAGAFGPAAVLRHGSNVQGVNWSRNAAPAGIDWGAVHEVGSGPGGITTRPVQPDWTGPGKAMPTLRVVEVDGAGTVVVHLPGRTPVRVQENEFLALLGLDPELSIIPLGIPVLFLTTGPGALSPQLVQTFSRITGRPAYGYSAPMLLAHTADPSAPLRILTLPAPAGAAPGHWTTATRQPTTRGNTATQDALTVFGTNDPDPAQVPDIGALRIGEGGEPPAGSLLSPGTLMTNASGAPRGRNLTGEKVRQLRVGRVRVFEEQPGAALKEVQGADADAPWGDTAYIVWGESHPDGVRFPDGRVLNAEKLAAELAADPELAKLPKTVPVVLVVPNLANERYLEYLRAVANLLERTAWAPSGDGRLVRNKKREHVPALIDHGPDHPLGAWVPFQPTKASAPFVDREWTALDGTKFRDSDVASRPVVSDRHERFGRMSHVDDVRDRERLMRSYLRAKKQVHLMASGGRTALISEEARTPDLAVYVFVAHGLPGGLLLALRDGRTVWLSAADGGRYIGGLPEVAELPSGHRMKVEVCFGGSAGNPTAPQLANRPAPPVRDPLEEVSLTQHTANESRLVTNGPLTSSGFDVDAHILHDTPDGVVGRHEDAFPEPLPHELDQRARTAGLHTGDSEAAPGVRQTALKLVRALRIVFGPEVETDSALYERLLTGIGALETLRANDPDLSRFTPFRMELWTFAAQRVSSGTPGPDDYRTVLDLAAQRLSQNPAARLGEALPDPLILHAQRQITQFGAVLVRNVLRLPENAPVTKSAVTWALWAMAGAARQMAGRDEAFTEKLGRRVLHLSPEDPWTPARKQQLWVMTAQAIAARLNPADYFTLAAFHLASMGAFGPAHALMDGEKFQGYNWSGTPAPGGVDLRVVGRQDRDGDGTSLTHFRAPWRADGEPEDVMVVWTDTGTDGFVVLHLPGTPPLRVADREFLALLEMALPLRAASLGIPVLFVLSGAGSGSGRPMTLSEAFSNRTARNGWAYSGPLTVAPGTPPQGTGVAPLRLVGLPEAGTGKQGVWRKAWLRGLGSSVLASAPYGDAVFSSPRRSGLLLSGAGAGVTVRRPLSRADLVALARRVAGGEPVRGMSVERCLVLLGALREALYPRGVRPAV